MYENASVLYRTKFVDGVSTVTRIAATGKGKKAIDSGDKENRPRMAN